MVSFWEMLAEDPNLDPEFRAIAKQVSIRIIEDEPIERERDDGPDFPPEVMRDGH
jgi:hypothetical protein